MIYTKLRVQCPDDDQFIKKADKLEVIPENVDDKGLLAAYEEAQKHNWSKDEYDAYIYAGMREQDEKGRETAAEKRGVEKQKIEAVLGLHENSIPVSIIAKSLKISKKEVEAIIKKHTEQK